MKHLKIKINHLEYEGDTVFKDIDFTINRTDRVSIVGNNGAGKTTLLKTITWEIDRFDGFIENIWNLKLWYLQQVYSDDETRTVLEELRTGFDHLVEIDNQLKQKEEAGNFDEQYYELFDFFQHSGGNEIESKIHWVANGMWFLDLLDKKLSEVSGWQRTKIALWKVLLESPDILFLDEPTNFIDMAWVEWLEGYLKNKWKGWYVIISHDREFLDKTCEKTYEIQPGLTLTYYHTNYSGYVIERKNIEKKKSEEFKRQSEYIDKQQQLINRFRAWSRAGWAKSREKMIDKMKKVDSPYIPKRPKFFFEYVGESPNKLFSLKEVFIWRQEPLFFVPEAILYEWQRMWIVWDNWVGKSTLLKTIIWQLEILDGQMTLWKSTVICYYSQMHEELDRDKTIKQNFEKHWMQFDDTSLIWLLNHYLFDKEDIDKKVSQLSWGQTSKLLFAILGQKWCNLLILDEPTNHLDYDTRESLEESLGNFKGTILFISHDRYFVNKLASHIWFITDGELSISYGNYEDYRFKLEHNIEMDMSLFDEEAQLNLVLEDKLWEKKFKKLKDKFSKSKKRSGK